MTLFHEMYGVYYRITGKLLAMKELKRSDINRVIYQYAFQDSKELLTKKLIPQKDGSDWHLFVDIGNDKTAPMIKYPPKNILTLLQRRWLAAKLNDPKMQLFLDKEQIDLMRSELGNIEPLYSSHHFRFTDRFSDGDDFSDKSYIRNFRAVLSAIKQKRLLKIKYISEKSGRQICYVCQPLKIEYSAKNDKFRIHCRTLRHGRLQGCTIINIGRIVSVSDVDIEAGRNVDMAKYYAKCRATEPVVVRVTNERNGVERFLTEFAVYEKNTVRDLETGECTTRIFYDKNDETELLIRLLSFGPVLEIVGPPHFRELARERVMKQCELTFPAKAPNGDIR